MIFEVRSESGVYDVEVAEDRAGLRIAVSGEPHLVQVDAAAGAEHYRLRVDGRPVAAQVRRAGDDLVVVIGSDRYRLAVRRKLPIARRGTETVGPPVAQVSAPMPGLVVAVEAEAGAAVERGRPVVILEAMKMQMEIRAPVDGRISAVRVRPGQEVGRGQVLAEIEPAAQKDRGAGDKVSGR